MDQAYSYSQLRRAVEAAEAREEERHAAGRKQRLEASRAASGAARPVCMI